MVPVFGPEAALIGNRQDERWGCIRVSTMQRQNQPTMSETATIARPTRSSAVLPANTPRARNARATVLATERIDKGRAQLTRLVRRGCFVNLPLPALFTVHLAPGAQPAWTNTLLLDSPHGPVELEEGARLIQGLTGLHPDFLPKRGSAHHSWFEAALNGRMAGTPLAATRLAADHAHAPLNGDDVVCLRLSLRSSGHALNVHARATIPTWLGLLQQTDWSHERLPLPTCLDTHVEGTALLAQHVLPAKALRNIAPGDVIVPRSPAFDPSGEGRIQLAGRQLHVRYQGPCSLEIIEVEGKVNPDEFENNADAAVVEAMFDMQPEHEPAAGEEPSQDASQDAQEEAPEQAYEETPGEADAEFEAQDQEHDTASDEAAAMFDTPPDDEAEASAEFSQDVSEEAQEEMPEQAYEEAPDEADAGIEEQDQAQDAAQDEIEAEAEAEAALEEMQEEAAAAMSEEDAAEAENPEEEWQQDAPEAMQEEMHEEASEETQAEAPEEVQEEAPVDMPAEAMAEAGDAVQAEAASIDEATEEAAPAEPDEAAQSQEILAAAAQRQAEQARIAQAHAMLASAETVVREEPAAFAARHARNELDDVPVTLRFELGRISLPLDEVRTLGAGVVLLLSGGTPASLAIVAGGRTLGRGEIVDVDGQVGVRVIEWGTRC